MRLFITLLIVVCWTQMASANATLLEQQQQLLEEREASLDTTDNDAASHNQLRGEARRQNVQRGALRRPDHEAERESQHLMRRSEPRHCC